MTKGKFRDLTGQRFGRLDVQGRAENRNRHVYWRCLCDCGNVVEVRGDGLTRGRTVSCGCFHQDVVTKHGMYQTSTYKTWHAMLQRCENPRCKPYPGYGGRGIKVCARWHEFEAFLEDMGESPEGLSLDRIDNDGDYEPENCRWATNQQQHRNRRDNVWLTYKGETRCIMGWAELMGMGYSTLKRRLEMGWTPKDALTVPVDLGNRWKRQQQRA